MGIAWNGAEASCDEFRRILEECGHKRRAMYLAQASSGMRIGEITQISREHLHTVVGNVPKIHCIVTKLF